MLKFISTQTGTVSDFTKFKKFYKSSDAQPRVNLKKILTALGWGKICFFLKGVS